jgi:hypothetical protein
MNYEAHIQVFTKTIIPNATIEALRELEQEFKAQYDTIEIAIYQAICKKIDELTKHDICHCY